MTEPNKIDVMNGDSAAAKGSRPRQEHYLTMDDPALKNDFDVCECGDYRHQHVNGYGACKLVELCTPSRCQKFRFFRGATGSSVTSAIKDKA